MHNSLDSLTVGVIGVGAMGRHHARVYNELPCTDLRGVTDVDTERAALIAATYGTRSFPLEDLLAEVDAVSIAVPTKYHYDTARACLDAGVHVLLEKPFVTDPEMGRELVGLAHDEGLTLQIGHIERFNPAVQVLDEILSPLDVIAVQAARLGPPPTRFVDDDAILDLMIHDLDVVLSLFDGDPQVLSAVGTRNNRFATATLEFPSGVVATLTASRLTQRKSRTLEISASECFIDVDYLSKSVEVHEHTIPSFAERGGTVDQRMESIIERPMIRGEEPLKAELGAFVEAIQNETPPVVTGEDGLRALELSLEIQRATTGAARVVA